jgi:hypothetical protein
MEATQDLSGPIRMHFIVLRSAVKLEKRGMRRSRGPSAKAIAIKELQLRRNATHDEVIEAIGKKLGE